MVQILLDMIKKNVKIKNKNRIFAIFIFRSSCISYFFPSSKLASIILMAVINLSEAINKRF